MVRPYLLRIVAFVLGGLGVALVVIGSFRPWFVLSRPSSPPIAISGVDLIVYGAPDYPVAILVAGLLGILFLVPNRMASTAIASVLGILVLVLVWVVVDLDPTRFFIRPGMTWPPGTTLLVGIGLTFTLLGGVLLTVGSVVSWWGLHLRHAHPTPSEKALGTENEAER